VCHFEANTAARQITEGIAGVGKFGIEHGDGFRRAWGLDMVVICDDDIDAFLARISDFRMVRDATVDRDDETYTIIFGKIDRSVRKAVRFFALRHFLKYIEAEVLESIRHKHCRGDAVSVGITEDEDFLFFFACHENTVDCVFH